MAVIRIPNTLRPLAEGEKEEIEKVARNFLEQSDLI